MKKKLIIPCGLLLAVLIPLQTYAGSINSAEQKVLDAASGTFTYNGREYAVTSTALAQLQAKLASDGTELDDAQADELIQKAYGNIYNGIDQGYLVPTDGKPLDEEFTGSSESEAEDEYISDWASDLLEGQKDENGSTSGDKTDKTNQTEKTNTTDKSDKTDTSSTGETTAAGVTIEKTTGEIKATTKSGETVYRASIPVKNTGFDLTGLLAATVALTGLLGICIAYVRRYRAHE